VAEAFKDIFELEEPPDHIEALKELNDRLPQHPPEKKDEGGQSYESVDDAVSN